MNHWRVYTAGSFDLFHIGHVRLLRRAARLGDATVALNTDEFIRSYKGHSPAIPHEQRREVLGSCRYVSAVIDQASDDLRPQLEKVRPDYVVVGSDWATRDYYAQTQLTQEWLDEREIVLVYVPYTQIVSTTKLRERLRVAA